MALSDSIYDSYTRFRQWIEEEVNFFRLHLVFFTITPLITSFIFYGVNGQFHIRESILSLCTPGVMGWLESEDAVVVHTIESRSAAGSITATVSRLHPPLSWIATSAQKCVTGSKRSQGNVRTVGRSSLGVVHRCGLSVTSGWQDSIA